MYKYKRRGTASPRQSIQAFNNTLVNFKGNVLLASHDREFMDTVCNRIIELTPNGIIDKQTTFDEYIENDDVKAAQQRMYSNI